MKRIYVALILVAMIAGYAYSAQQTLNNGDSHGVIRGQINDNFTEIYTGTGTNGWVRETAPTIASPTITGTTTHSDGNITNVGDISLDTISSDAGTSVQVTLGTDAADDFKVNNGSDVFVIEGDNSDTSFEDNDINNVGDIAVDTISSDAGTSVQVTLGTDAADDFKVNNGSDVFVIEGDNSDTSFEDNDINNVGDIAVDTISSDAGTSVQVTLGTDAADDFKVNNGSDVFVIEGDNSDTSFEDNDINNVGDIAVDTISSDAGTSVQVTLGTDAADDFKVNNGGDIFLVEGDTGNVGIGNSSLESWHSSYTAAQIGGNAAIFASAAVGAAKTLNVAQNVYYDGGWKHISTGKASIHQQVGGEHIFYVATSGAADAAVSWGTALAISNAGDSSFGDHDINNVGDIAVDTISSDASTSVQVTLGTDAADDFKVNNGSDIFIVEGDTGNVGIENSSIESWDPLFTALQIGRNFSLMGTTSTGGGGEGDVLANAYYDDVDNRWEYQDAGSASLYQISSGSHNWRVAGAGAADAAVTWTTGMSVSATTGIVAMLPVYSHDMNGETIRDLQINNSGELGYDSSTRRKKTNIKAMEDTTWLYDLRPVTFEYKKKDKKDRYTEEGTGRKEYGLIAEEVDEVNSTFVFYNETETGLEVEGVHYKKLIPVLLNEIQRLSAQAQKLSGRIGALENK